MAESDKRGEHEGVNVQVLLRCRPLSDKEIADRVPQVVSCSDALREVTLFSNTGGKQSSRAFRFDRVFGSESTQEKLFKQAIVPIVEEVLDGFNCTIFAYGQTGTGKTYTMEGGPRQSADGRKLSAEAGVIPRSIKQIFDTIEANQTDATVKVSFLELYNEELTDLLVLDSDDKVQRLRLLEDRAGVVAQGLEEVIVKSAVEIYQVLDRGTAKRRTAETQLNKRSSRSHSVFTITIHMREATPEGEDVVKIGKLNLVDLAGSENISRSGAKDARAREAGSINQSLLTLGRVITALVEHSGHIPYRDSKLTRLLRDSLGGRTKTCIIATIAPTVQCQEETISTLDYAHRAKNIRNRPEVNQKVSKTAMLNEQASEIKKLKLILEATVEKSGVYLPKEQHQADELERAQLRETVRTNRAEVEAIDAQRELAETALEALQATFTEKEREWEREMAERVRELTDVRDQLTDAKITIQERQFVAQSHERAEAALAAHAESLTAELHSFAQDVGQLLGKLEEAARLQDADRVVMTEIRNKVGSRSQQLGAAVLDVLASQSKHHQDVSIKLARFVAKKDDDQEALQGQLSAIHTSILALQSAVSGQLTSGIATVNSSFKGVQTCAAEYATNATAAAAAAQAAVDAQLQALTAALEAQARELRAFALRQEAQAQAALQAVQVLAAGVSAGVTGMHGDADGLRRGAAQAHAAAGASLAELSSRLEASARKQQQAIVEQVVTLMARYASEQQEALAAGVSGVAQQLMSNSQLVDSKVEALTLRAAGLLEETETSSTAVRSQLRQSFSTAANQSEAVAEAVVSCSGHVGVLGKQLYKQQAARETALATHVEAVSGQVNAGSAAMQHVADSTVAKLEVAAATLAGAHSRLIHAVAEQHDADVKVSEGLAQAGRTANTALAAFGDTHGQQIADLGRSVCQDTDRQLDVPPASSAAVKRREVQMPAADEADELRCPPEDVILEQYRRERAHFLRRGVSCRNGNALVTPRGAVSQSMLARLGPLTPRPAGQSNGSEENAPSSPGSGASSIRGHQEAPKSATKATGRSRIPSAPAGSGLRAQGLADRTNM